MTKSLAFEATAEDVAAAALAKGVELDLNAAEALLPSLDAAAIEKAALHGDGIDDQTRYAQEEIASQMDAKGLLPATPAP